MLRNMLATAVALAVGAGALLVAAAPDPAGAVASGCTAARPTWVGGSLRGSDGRMVNAHIGVDLTGGGQPRNVDGTVNTTGGYAHIWKLNSTTPPTGTPVPPIPPGGQVFFGVCVAANVTTAFFEGYPKRPSPDPMVTDFTRYGETAYYFAPITPGATNLYGIRLPVTWQNGGNTGGVQGYVTYHGRAVPASAIHPTRLFTRQPGSACGVEGLAASANQLGTSPDGARTFYKFDYAAGGPCGAPSQPYTMRMTCVDACVPGKSLLITKQISIVAGRWPRVDVSFG